MHEMSFSIHPIQERTEVGITTKWNGWLTNDMALTIGDYKVVASHTLHLKICL